MAEPTTQEHIRWALMALYLVRNKLVAMGVDKNDTAMVNLAAAEETLRSIADEDPHVMSALNAGVQRDDAPLTPAELKLLAQVDEEFADCGETNVEPAALLDFARRGYLECNRFEFTDKGAKAVFRYIHGTDPEPIPNGVTGILKGNGNG